MTEPNNQFQDLVKDPWRQLEEPEQQDFAEWASIKIRERAIFGEKKYHSSLMGFQGDPLIQLTQEAFDSLFYSWMAEKEREYHLERIAELERFNEQLRGIIAQGIELGGKKDMIAATQTEIIESQHQTILAWEATAESPALDIDLLRNRLETSENYAQGMEDYIKELRETIATMNDGIAKNAEEIGNLVGTIDGLRTEATDLQNEILATGGALNQACAERDGLAESLDESASEVVRLNNEIAELNRQIAYGTEE